MKRATRFAGLGFLLCWLSTAIEAQACFGPDNLDGPCCALQMETLPPFPALNMSGSAIAWDSCNALPKVNLGFQLGAPTLLECGSYTASLTAIDAVGNVVASAPLELTYSRTWDESAPSGMIFQVYRFLIMGDVNTLPPSALGGILPADSPSFYHGYVDYARGCNFTNWDYAFVLYHNCDAFQHMPAFSANPGPHDPTRTFAFVAPDTTAQPFDHVSVVPPLSGSLVAGAMRDPGPPGVAICPVRDRVQPASLNVLVTGCACPFSATLPPRNAASQLAALGQCGGQTISLDVMPTLPWLHLMSSSIGRWTTAGAYPGPEGALVYEGPLLWHEGCAGGVFGTNFVELHYGGGTLGGWPRLSTAPPVQSMLDMRSNWSAALPGPIPLPLVGGVMSTPFIGKRHVFTLDLN